MCKQSRYDVAPRTTLKAIIERIEALHVLNVYICIHASHLEQGCVPRTLRFIFV